MPKSERPITERRRNPNKFVFKLAVFGYCRSVICFLFEAKLDRFIYKGVIKRIYIYIKRSTTSRNVRNSNIRTNSVWISDRFSTEQKLQPNDGYLSEIRTCSDYRLEPNRTFSFWTIH